jgi:hypothetical protein
MCIKSKSSTMSNDSPILLRLLGRSWDKFLLIGCCLLAGWMLIMWLLPHWDYLPDWAPVPGPRLMDPLKCVQPIILCGLGLPTLLAFVVGLIANLVLLLNRVLSRHIGGMVVLGVGLMIISPNDPPTRRWWPVDSVDSRKARLPTLSTGRRRRLFLGSRLPR